MLLMLIIASSCEINDYQPVQNEERTDVVIQEEKREPSEWDIFVDAPKREAVEDVLRHQYGYEVINGLKIHDYEGE